MGEMEPWWVRQEDLMLLYKEAFLNLMGPINILLRPGNQIIK